MDVESSLDFQAYCQGGVNHEHDQPAHLKVKEEAQNHGR